MGKKKKEKAKPKPWQNDFDGLSDGMETFWQAARDNIYEKRNTALLNYLEKVQMEKGEEVSCQKGGYGKIPEKVLELEGLKVLDFSRNIITEANISQVRAAFSVSLFPR